MAERKSSKISLKPIDMLLGVEDNEQRIEVPISKLHCFKNHPFRVLDDEDMYRLAESIKENGVLNPLVVRPAGEDYEIVSGHRRKRACELVGIEKLPVIIKEMDDDESIIYMVDSNIQRTSLLISEKAFSSKMRYEAMKRQGRRTDLDESQKGSSIDRLAKDYDCSPNTLRRLFRMTELIPELLDMVDNKKMAFNSAVEISYLTNMEQKSVLSFIRSDEVCPSLGQSKELRRLSKRGALNDEKIMDVFTKKENTGAIRIKGKILKQFFSEKYSIEQIEEIIVGLLTEWASGNVRIDSINN